MFDVRRIGPLEMRETSTLAATGAARRTSWAAVEGGKQGWDLSQIRLASYSSYTKIHSKNKLTSLV